MRYTINSPKTVALQKNPQSQVIFSVEFHGHNPKAEKEEKLQRKNSATANCAMACRCTDLHLLLGYFQPCIHSQASPLQAFTIPKFLLTSSLMRYKEQLSTSYLEVGYNSTVLLKNIFKNTQAQNINIQTVTKRAHLEGEKSLKVLE